MSEGDFTRINREQVELLREVFDYLFLSVVVEPGWRTSTVRDVARGIYEENAFDRMPILADALEEAGCSDEKLLG